MTPEEKQQRIEQIRAGAERLRFERDKEDLLASTDVERAYENTISDLLKDVNFLLSLVKEQEAGSGWLLEKMHNGSVHYIAADYVLEWTDDPIKALRLARRKDAEALCTIVEDCEKIAEHGWPASSSEIESAITAMRSACVEKVRSMRDDWEAERNKQEPLSKLRNRYDAAFCGANEIMAALKTLSIEKDSTTGEL